MSQWNGPVGPVTMKNAYGNAWVFPTLIDAIKASGRRQFVERFPEPFLGVYYNPWMGDNVILQDECGLTVPLWRIEREAQGYEPPQRPWRRFGYDPERNFRNGPIPCTGSRRGRRCYRRVRTHAERRDLFGLEADLQDAEDFPVRIKIRTRRKNIPTLWDDIAHSRRGESWKNYRRTRYK